MQQSVVETRGFWKRQGAGRLYDQEFSSLIGWYVHVSETQPFKDLFGQEKGLSILDVGCGTGRVLAVLPPQNQMTGLDYSPEMLAEAQKKLPNAQFIEGSATELPFPDASFDRVITVRVIQHIRDQKKAVQEMARVCKPGGKVIVMAYNSWSLLCLYKQLRMSALGRILNIPLHAVLKRRSFLNPWGFAYDNYVSAPEVSGWMKQSGLRVEKVWGATLGQPWLFNDLFIGKVLEKLVPNFFKAWLSFALLLDRTLARCFPLQFFSDKIVVVGTRKE